jgi:hypothetical protein
MFVEIDSNEHREMQLKFQDLPNPSGFVTTSIVGGTDPNLTAANQMVITQKCWVLMEQQQVFA